MGRTKENEKKQLLLRIVPELWMESIMLNPQLQDEKGYLRYGAISNYFSNLMRKDNEVIKDRLRREAKEGANGEAPTSSI